MKSPISLRPCSTRSARMSGADLTLSRPSYSAQKLQAALGRSRADHSLGRSRGLVNDPGYRVPAAGETRSSTKVFHSWQWGHRQSMSSAR